MPSSSSLHHSASSSGSSSSSNNNNNNSKKRKRRSSSIKKSRSSSSSSSAALGSSGSSRSTHRHKKKRQRTTTSAAAPSSTTSSAATSSSAASRTVSPHSSSSGASSHSSSNSPHNNSPQNSAMDVNAFMQQMILAGARAEMRSSMSESDAEEIQELLQGELFQKLEAANRLCTFYSMMQHPMGGRVNLFAPILVQLFSTESNIDLLILVARCLTNMLDAIPDSGYVLIKQGLLSTINAKLLNIEYIDLAEQCIRFVETMAQDFRAHVLQSGVLPSAMTYIDFHAISVQRKILHIASILSKSVYSDNYSNVKSIMPQLCNFIASDDKTMAEYAINALSNIIEGLDDDLEQLEDFCSANPIIEKFASILSSPKDLASNRSSGVMSKVFTSLRILSQHSITAFEQLHKQNFGKILLEVVEFNREYASDCTKILVHMLPPANEHNQTTSEMASGKHAVLLRQHVLGEAVSLSRADSSSSLVDSCDPNIEFFMNHPTIFPTYASSVLPLLLETFSSTTDVQTQLSCLSGLASIVNFASDAVLKEMLFSIPISTFLADLLSSHDLVHVSTAIQICEGLISKLPEIFKVFFVREGVLSELEKISGTDSADLDLEDDSLLVQLRKQVNEKSQQKKKSTSSKKRSTTKSSSKKSTTSNDASAKPSSVSSPSRGSPTRDKIMSFLSRKKKRNSTSSAASTTSPMEDASPTTTTTSPSASTTEELFSLDIPEDSRLHAENSKNTSFKNESLREFCVVYADEIQRLYFSDAEAVQESAFSKQLSTLSEKLLNASELTEQEQCLETIRDLINLGKDEEKVTNFEFVRSKVMSSLVQYLSGASMNQLASFLNIFNRPLNMSPSMLASSPHKKAISSDSHYSHLRELVHRLQECLSSEESFPIFEDRANGAVQSLRELSRPLRLYLQSPRRSRSSVLLEVRVNPMAPMSAVLTQLEKIIEQKKSKKKSKKSDTSPAMQDDDVQQEDEASLSEENYFHTEEDEEDEDEEFSPRVLNLGTEDSVASVDTASKYAFLKEPLDATQDSNQSSDQASAQSFAYELYVDGSDHEIDINGSVFREVYLSTLTRKNSRKHPSKGKMWNTRHVIKYRKKSSREQTKDATSSSTNSSSSVYLESRVKHLIDSALVTIDKGCRSSSQNISVRLVLQLLSIFDILNRFASEIIPGWYSSSLVPRSEFVNHKISSKLQKQVSDPFVVLSKVLPEWIFFLSKSCQFLFTFSTRINLFSISALGIGRALLTLQRKNSQRNEPRIQISHQKIRVPRQDLFKQAYRYFMKESSHNLSQCEVEFFNEAGTGLGPTAEFFSLISDHFKRTDLDIWITSDPTAEFVHAPAGLYPKCIDPSSEKEEQLQFYRNTFRFMGKYMARSIMDDRLIDMPLSFALLKALKGEDLCFDDIRYIDPQLYSSLRKFSSVLQTKKQIEQSMELSAAEKKESIYNLTLDGARFDDLCQSFTLIGSDIELIEGGHDIEVTVWNLEDYLRLTSNWLLREGVKVQVQAFREGFSELVNPKYLGLLSNMELEILFAGEDKQWTHQMLTKALVYDHGYTSSSRPIQDLLLILSELNLQQRRAFVRFVTGSPRLPVGGLSKLKPRLTVVRKGTGTANADTFLPSCMTCTHYLKLPEYSSVEIMRERLLTALSEGQNAFHLS